MRRGVSTEGSRVRRKGKGLGGRVRVSDGRVRVSTEGQGLRRKGRVSDPAVGRTPSFSVLHPRDAGEERACPSEFRGGVRESNFVVPASPALRPSAESKRLWRGGLWQGRRPCPSGVWGAAGAEMEVPHSCANTKNAHEWATPAFVVSGPPPALPFQRSGFWQGQTPCPSGLL